MASSPAPSVASKANGDEGIGGGVSSVASPAANLGASADAVADEKSATNKEINDCPSNSKFCALLQWLRTFPHLAEFNGDGSSCDFGNLEVVR